MLETISIQKCDMLTDEIVADIFARCPKLTSLTILGGHQIRLVSSKTIENEQIDNFNFAVVLLLLFKFDI